MTATNRTTAELREITVDRASLLKIVRHLDFGAPCDSREFGHAFDNLRCAFDAEEIATGELKSEPQPPESTAQLREVIEKLRSLVSDWRNAETRAGLCADPDDLDLAGLSEAAEEASYCYDIAASHFMLWSEDILDALLPQPPALGDESINQLRTKAREYAEANGLSIRALADLVGISFSTLARFLRSEGNLSANHSAVLRDWMGSKAPQPPALGGIVQEIDGLFAEWKAAAEDDDERRAIGAQLYATFVGAWPTLRANLKQEEWRPEVKKFADLMEAKLRENDHKPGWQGDNAFDLLKRLQQEMSELQTVTRKAFDESYWDNPDYKDDGQWHPPGTNKRYIYRFATDKERADLAPKVPLEAADVANFAMMIADVCAALPTPPQYKKEG